MLDQPHNRGMASRMHFLQHLEVEAGQDNSLPTSNRAGRFVSFYESLCVHYVAAAKEGRAQQCEISVNDRSLDCTCDQRWCSQLPEGLLRFRRRICNLNPVSAGGSVSFQNTWKPDAFDPPLKLGNVSDDRRFRNTHALFPCHAHEIASCVDQVEPYRRTERPLDHF